MLYHKGLKITEEDIKSETNIDLLKNWRNVIAKEIVDIKRIQQDIKDKSVIRRSTDAKYYKAQILGIIEVQLKTLKMKGSKDVLLMRKFMKVAKQELSKDVYKNILNQAKELSGYNK